jgi:hypothetical protein
VADYRQQYWGQRSRWDNVGDFLMAFADSSERAQEREQARQRDLSQRKLQFQQMDPEMQEALRPRLSNQEKVDYGLATKDPGNRWNPFDTKYVDVKTRGRTKKEKAEFDILEQQIAAGDLSLLNQKIQTTLGEMDVAMRTIKDPIETKSLQDKQRMIDEGGKEGASLGAEVLRNIALGMDRQSAERVAYARRYPDLYNKQLLRELNPLDEYNINAEVNKLMPQMAEYAPMNPEKHRALARAMVLGDEEMINQVLTDKTIKSKFMIDLQNHKEQMGIQRQQLEFSRQSQRSSIMMTMQERFPNMNTYELNTFASDIMAGRTPTGQTAEAIAVGRQAMAATARRTAEQVQGQIDDREYNNLASGVASLTSKATSETLSSDEKAKVKALTQRMMEILATKHGVTFPPPGTSNWQYFMNIIAAGTGVASVAASAVTDETPQGKAARAFTEELTKNFGEALPKYDVPPPYVNPEPGNPRTDRSFNDWEDFFGTSPAAIEGKLQDSAISLSQKSPAVAAGTRALFEDKAREVIALHANAPDGSEQKAYYRALIDKYNSFLKRLPGGTK